MLLDKIKEEKIINASIEIFSSNDYDKALTDDIAYRAGLSKGLLFHYFKNKRALYIHVLDYLTALIEKQVIDDEYDKITDFFDLLDYCVAKKMECFKFSPYILDFCVRVFYSRKEDVSEYNNLYLTKMYENLSLKYFKNIDCHKFKEDIILEDVMKMLIWLADGYLHEQNMAKEKLDLDALLSNFEKWKNMLKVYAYREEYL